MIRRGFVVALLLHLIYAAAWLTIGEQNQLYAERYAVTVAVTIAFVSYTVLVVAYWRARKTKLNTALAVNKGYWALLLGLLILPGQWGVLIRDAPYRLAERNPYSYWIAPAWLRTYLWVFLTISIVGVLYEFCDANDWFRPTPATPPAEDRLVSQGPERREPPAGRATGDRGPS